MLSVAINGCGRIGKTLVRILCCDPICDRLIRIKAINLGPADADALEYLLLYDSILGTFEKTVRYDGKFLQIGEHTIAIYLEPDARKLPWREMGIDWVVDVSGAYTKRERASYHLEAGAKAVLISAPAEGEDVTIIPGINDGKFDPSKHKIVSLGSCTTNAVVPILKVLLDHFHIESGSIMSVHAYTNTQALLDVNPKKSDLRRSRAAALNIVPTSTGAMESVFRVFPHLREKFTGLAVRVPVPVVSLIDVTINTEQELQTSSLVDLFQNAVKQEPLSMIMAVTAVPLVSSDYQGNPYSVVVDATMIMAAGRLGRILGWYDNEYGYSMRLRDFLMRAAEL